jgi:uncharacterized CHY-type Zn-finger protein
MIYTVECPKCHNKIGPKPTKSLSNCAFIIELYECGECGNKLKVTRYKR